MNEEIAREIFERFGIAISENNALISAPCRVIWTPGSCYADLDDICYIEELKAIVWWMENKNI
jgi:hypothetical protein